MHTALDVFTDTPLKRSKYPSECLMVCDCRFLHWSSQQAEQFYFSYAIEKYVSG